LYQQIRDLPQVKHAFVGSGIRYDLALLSPEFIEKIAQYHTSGYLKIAPEHTNPDVLKLMLKPSPDTFDKFYDIFTKTSQKCEKKQYIIPYFIASHPGCGEKEMLDVVRWLKSRRIFVDQVQNFLPTPMSASTTMFYTGYNPHLPIENQQPEIKSAKSPPERARQKAILRYHAPENLTLIQSLMKKYPPTR
jgi:uncharacterized radical SAM protein YgiQ